MDNYIAVVMHARLRRSQQILFAVVFCDFMRLTGFAPLLNGFSCGDKYMITMRARSRHRIVYILCFAELYL